MVYVSIIIPVFNEEENVHLLYERLAQTIEGAANSYELIFVDDGSSDNSLEMLKGLAAKDKRIRVIKLSRNFGSHAACFCGLLSATGDVACVISCDLQDPPELIFTLIAEWEKGYEAVFGVRKWEEQSTRLLPKIYYKLVQRYALKNMPEHGTDVFLIDKKILNVLKEVNEKNTSIFGLILWSGFKQRFITYSKGQRQRGVSKWTSAKKIKLFIDTFVSFSHVPMRVISLTGLFVSLLGFLYTALILFNKVFFSIPVEGWASLMVVLLVVSGVQMLMIGVLGEYLLRIYDESRKRPSFIVSEKIGFD
ncbi:MAG: glycosyltransferase family 2 protein [Candidatus Magnetoovum sp. WYHC-5]|nr:glycosyltransferase family 2 protein [Candidatus Magnetoovum sp. WYHC-5]